MKNILIGGTIRAGKSTLAYLIKNKLNYSVCECDTIVNAFHKVFPDLGIVHNKPKEARENFKPFLYQLLNGFLKGLNWYNNVTIFPGSQFLPNQIDEYPKKENYIVIFLGINDVKPEDLAKTIRDNESEFDWTQRESDESLLALSKNIIDESNYLKNECAKFGFYYFNTYFDRENVFNSIINLIEELEK